MPLENSEPDNSPPLETPPSLVVAAASPTTAPTDGELPKIEGETPKVEGEAPKVETPTEFVPLTRESLKFAEGLTYDDAIVDEALGLMNNQELTPEGRLQGLIDLQAKVANAASEASSNAWNTLQDQWQKDAKADPEFGGDKFQSTLTNVGKLVAEYGTDGLREALDTTGAGNHPEVIRFLGKISTLLTEGRPVTGGATSGTTANLAQRLFPSMK